MRPRYGLAYIAAGQDRLTEKSAYAQPCVPCIGGGSSPGLFDCVGTASSGTVFQLSSRWFHYLECVREQQHSTSGLSGFDEWFSIAAKGDQWRNPASDHGEYEPTRLRMVQDTTAISEWLYYRLSVPGFQNEFLLLLLFSR